MQASLQADLPSLQTCFVQPAYLFLCSTAVEAEFQQHVAVRRRPILLLVFCFDVVCYLFRMAVKFARTDISLTALLKGIFPQLCNMMLLYTFLGLLNRRSRRLGYSAARQVSQTTSRSRYIPFPMNILAFCRNFPKCSCEGHVHVHSKHHA